MEMGPKNLTTGLTKQIWPDAVTYCFGQKKDRETLAEFYKNDTAHLADIPDFLGRCLGIAVSTKNSNDSLDEYETGVVEPYRAIKNLRASLTESGGKADIEHYKTAVSLLKQIMDTKKVDANEQADWLKRLYDETSTMYLMA